MNNFNINNKIFLLSNMDDCPYVCSKVECGLFSQDKNVKCKEHLEKLIKTDYQMDGNIPDIIKCKCGHYVLNDGQHRLCIMAHMKHFEIQANVIIDTENICPLCGRYTYNKDLMLKIDNGELKIYLF